MQRIASRHHIRPSVLGEVCCIRHDFIHAEHILRIVCIGEIIVGRLVGDEIILTVSVDFIRCYTRDGGEIRVLLLDGIVSCVLVLSLGCLGRLEYPPAERIVHVRDEDTCGRVHLRQMIIRVVYECIRAVTGEIAVMIVGVRSRARAHSSAEYRYGVLIEIVDRVAPCPTIERRSIPITGEIVGVRGGCGR